MIFYVPAVLVLFVACSKYEEGPAFSMRSKAERISNHWVISTVYLNGTDITMSYYSTHRNFQLNIGRDKQYTLTYAPSPTEFHMENGDWRFNGDKTHVVLSDSNGGEVDYTIRKLDKSELWLSSTNNEGHEVELRLMPKPES